MSEPEVLWRPPADVMTASAIGRFATARGFDDYESLWRWSIDDLEGFWGAVWDDLSVRPSSPYERVLSSRVMPGARWFEGARLNYAEQALRRRGNEPAVVGVSQSPRARVELSWDELVDLVARARAGLARLGVGPGDRVAAFLPNIPETIVAFLATASLGAVWSSCAPEFGVRAVLDRFSQIEPGVLLVVDGYRYGERDMDRRDAVDALRAGLPSVRATVRVPYLYPVSGDDVSWDDLVREPPEPGFEPVAPDHPLYVLFSSGTTGMPKPIVHGHGGILLEHLKVLALHADLGEGDRFAWFTTTGWMMWNYLVSGLLVGSTVVCFDGDPAWPDLDTLWRLTDEERLTWLGASAPFVMACRKAGLRPGADHDLSRLRAFGSTGAPLPADGFRWVYDAVRDSVLLSSISGGTDVCTAFVGGCPMVPVRAGEISCRYLGAAVEAFSPDGRSLVGEQGELVITAPMPSMPVGFWGDASGERYRAAYFDRFPGVWWHGDWITITARGSCTITGRSDATLNRGGVRIGTSEIYGIVEGLDDVADSLVVHLEDEEGGGPGVLVMLVVPAAGTDADETALANEIRGALRRELSPRHAPDEVHVVPAIPTTLSGKKLEVPVKRILAGADADTVASRDALRDPDALDAIVALRDRRGARELNGDVVSRSFAPRGRPTRPRAPSRPHCAATS